MDVNGLIQEALDKKILVDDILKKGLLAGMEVVGVKFKNCEFYVPEVLVAASRFHSGMDILRPYIIGQAREPVATLVIGTVKGDLHDIGKNLVAMMMEGAGIKVIDLGIDCSSEKFISAVREHHPNWVAISALLTTTMGCMEDVVKTLEKENLRKDLKIIIGGAPITEEFCRKIRADYFAPDAATGAEIVRNSSTLVKGEGSYEPKTKSH